MRVLLELLWSICHKFGLVFRVEVVIKLIKLIVKRDSWHLDLIQEVINLIYFSPNRFNLSEYLLSQQPTGDAGSKLFVVVGSCF